MVAVAPVVIMGKILQRKVATMSKMYAKSDLSNVNGLLVAEDGTIITPDPYVVRLANELETLAQKADYLAEQPSATPMPSLDGFVRKSINDDVFEGAKFEATTPLLELEAMKTMAMMEELDDQKSVAEANAMVKHFSRLIEFANSSFVIDYGTGDLRRFDTPTLGDVLTLRQKDITNTIATINGLIGDDDCADCDDVSCALHPDHNKGEKIDGNKLVHDIADAIDSLENFCNDIEDGTYINKE